MVKVYSSVYTSSKDILRPATVTELKLRDRDWLVPLKNYFLTTSCKSHVTLTWLPVPLNAEVVAIDKLESERYYTR